MRQFRVYVDGNVFYHPNLSKLAITEAKVSEDAENIDSLTLSAPYNHPYIDSIKPMASVIVCKKAAAWYLSNTQEQIHKSRYGCYKNHCHRPVLFLQRLSLLPFYIQSPMKRGMKKNLMRG